MGVMQTIKRWWSRNPLENPAVPLDGKHLTAWSEGYMGNESGEPVNGPRALTLSPVWQAIALISGDVAKLPWICYQRMPNGSRERAVGHPVYKLCKYDMGRQITPEWLQTVMTSALLYGNGFAEIRRFQNMPREVLFVDPWRIEIIKYNTEDWTYQIHDEDGRVREVGRRDLFHLVGPQMYECAGMSLVQYAAQSLGTMLGGDSYTAEFFGNAAVPSGYFKTEGFRNESAQSEFVKSVQQRHAGHGNRWKAGVLPKGVDWVPAGINARDAQLIELLEMNVKDTARWFNLPPHKLGDDSRISYNSLEQENASYLQSSLKPWLIRIEAESTNKFFPSSNLQGGDATYYTEFSTDEFLYVSESERVDSDIKKIQYGLANANELRTRDNVPPRPDGDDYYVAANLTNVTNPPEPPPQLVPQIEEQPEEENDDSEQTEAVMALMQDTLRRQVSKVFREARKQKPQYFLEWLHDMPVKMHREVEPSIATACRVARIDARNVTRQFLTHAQSQLRERCECPNDQLADSIDAAKKTTAEYTEDMIRVLI